MKLEHNLASEGAIMEIENIYGRYKADAARFWCRPLAMTAASSVSSQPLCDQKGHRIQFFQELFFDSKIGRADRRNGLPAKPVGIGFRAMQPLIQSMTLRRKFAHERRKLVLPGQTALPQRLFKGVSNKPRLGPIGVILRQQTRRPAAVDSLHQSEQLRIWTGSNKPAAGWTI